MNDQSKYWDLEAGQHDNIEESLHFLIKDNNVINKSFIGYFAILLDPHVSYQKLRHNHEGGECALLYKETNMSYSSW